MQIHELKKIHTQKEPKRVGRGGRRGTYCGRGIKGQKARSGVSIDPLFEGGRTSLVERMKKMPGFKSLKPKKVVLKIEEIEKNFQDGENINLDKLVKSGLVAKMKSRKSSVKILGGAKIKKKFIIGKEIELSRSAREAVEKAGGQVGG